MPTKSLARGDYSLLLAVESSSSAQTWYRVLTDRVTGVISCDCPTWLFNRAGAATIADRECGHKDIGQLLAETRGTQLGQASSRPASLPPEDLSALLSAVQFQWPGLHGEWSIDSQEGVIGDKPYLFVLVRLVLGTGAVATGTVAFALRHRPPLTRLQAGVAGWCGYAIAAEVARLGGFPLAGQPPEHFTVAKRMSGRQRPADQRLGLVDILRVGDQVDLGDGLDPKERAENTLRMFLGEQLYQQLETQHFLDVSSYRFPGRVYRLRRDPLKRRDRRIRLFENGEYTKDLCVVRDQDVPEGDVVLTVFLGLLSDEASVLEVVKHYNIFHPYSDVPHPVSREEREVVPARWVPRSA